MGDVVLLNNNHKSILLLEAVLFAQSIQTV